jgi:hypothetical protein
MAHRFKHKFIIIMCVGVIVLNAIYPLIYVTNMLQMTQDFVQVSFQIYDSVNESTSSNKSEPHQKIVATRTFDGFCQKTGHKMKILDRNVTWRGSLHEEMICPRNNWIAMPQGQKNKNATRELWEQYCKNDTNSTNTINLSSY